MSGSLRIEEIDPRDAEARALIEAAEADLATNYAPEHMFGMSADELVGLDTVFLIARADGAPVGCGGVSFYGSPPRSPDESLPGALTGAPRSTPLPRPNHPQGAINGWLGRRSGVERGRRREPPREESRQGSEAERTFETDTEGYGELKRIFTAKAGRRRGVASAIVARLEEVAKARGVHVLRLETGGASPDALGLYGRLGYRRRGPFGDYEENGSSVFMEKRLGGG